jgi:hypothetical protein
MARAAVYGVLCGAVYRASAQVVRTAEHKRTRQKYAVKFIDKSRSEQTGFADTIQVQHT